MAEGKSYGRFSGRGTSAYDVMTQAKKMGAKKRSDEAYEKWLDKYDVWQGKMGQAKKFGDLVDIASMFLLPNTTMGQGMESALHKMGMHGDTVGKIGQGVGAAKKAGLGWGLGSIAQKLMEQWTMGGGIFKKREAPEFKATDVGIYGTEFIDPISKQIGKKRDDVRDMIEKIYQNRLLTHSLKSFGDEFSIADFLGGGK